MEKKYRRKFVSIAIKSGERKRNLNDERDRVEENSSRCNHKEKGRWGAREMQRCVRIRKEIEKKI